MTITTKFKQQLRAKAHQLKPIVYIGSKGFTENVRDEIDRGLTDHELIKIRIQGMDRSLRKALFTEICENVSAEAVQLVGGTGVLYRKGDKI